MITYKKGNLFDNLSKDKKNLILHVCNDDGGFGSGFAATVARLYPSVQQAYYVFANTGLWGADVTFKLGQVQWITSKENQNVVFGNLIAQSTPGIATYRYFNRTENHAPFRPESFRECLYNVAVALDKHGNLDKINLCSPLMGCGLAGGQKEVVFGIVDEVFGHEINLTVWEL